MERGGGGGPREKVLWRRDGKREDEVGAGVSTTYANVSAGAMPYLEVLMQCRTQPTRSTVDPARTQ